MWHHVRSLISSVLSSPQQTDCEHRVHRIIFRFHYQSTSFISYQQLWLNSVQSQSYLSYMQSFVGSRLPSRVQEDVQSIMQTLRLEHI